MVARLTNEQLQVAKTLDESSPDEFDEALYAYVQLCSQDKVDPSVTQVWQRHSEVHTRNMIKDLNFDFVTV